MDLQSQGYLPVGHHRLEVGLTGPVGGPHLDQASPRLSHHLRDPEPATDLNQLAA